MKKIYLTAIFLLSLSIFLIGCSEEKEDLGLEKAQKVEVVSAESPESVLAVLDTKKELEGFIDNLKVEEWSNEDLPSDVAESRTFKLYQEDTVKLGEDPEADKELKQLATITTYKETPYITFQMKKLNFHFKVPKDVAEYLSSLEK